MQTTSPSPQAEALLQKGMAASQADDRDVALEFFRQCCLAEPAWGIPFFLLGSEWAASGDFNAAEAALATAVLNAPELHIARFQLGTLQMSAGRAAVAHMTWQPLLQLPVTDPLPHYVSGYLALASDRAEEALFHFRAGLACSNDNLPLVSDIQQVIQSTSKLLAEAQSDAPSQSIRSAEGHPASDTDHSGHVLLANYQQSGQMH